MACTNLDESQKLEKIIIEVRVQNLALYVKLKNMQHNSIQYIVGGHILCSKDEKCTWA